MNKYDNKKVLLRERKRHTDCRVASTRYAAPAGGGGVPQADAPLLGVPRTGAPCWGVPWVGTPLPGVPQAGTPLSGGTLGRCPPAWTWDGVPPPPSAGWGTPLPDVNWHTDWKHYLPSYYVRGR